MTNVSITPEWEGQTVDGKYALLEWLGGSGNQGVFLTLRLGVQKAAIKLILADGSAAEAQLAQWEAAKSLSHPHLLPVLATGRWQFGEARVVYVVTELADHVLSESLPVGPSSPEKVKDFVLPVLDALLYLHELGYVHGHVKPSNIVVASKALKLSGDRFLVAEGVPRPTRETDVHDPPEIGTGRFTKAVDAWGVGMTIAEAMTQLPPVWDGKEIKEPVVQGTLLAPFDGIVRDCLRSDPERRCSIKEIRDRIVSSFSGIADVVPAETKNPDLAVMPAAPSADAHVEAPAKDDTASTPEPVFRPRARFSEDEPEESAPRLNSLRSFEEPEESRFRILPIVIGIIALLAIAAVFAVRSGWVQRTVARAPAENATSSGGAGTQANATTPAAPQPFTATPMSGSHSDAATGPPVAGQPATAPQAPPAASEHSTVPDQATKQALASRPMEGQSTPPPEKSAARPKEIAPPSHQAENANGAVTKRVMPYVSRNAVGDIRGMVAVEARLSVNAKGQVTNADYVSPGPGNYFARTAHKAALEWEFDPPIRAGHAVPSVWILRFNFHPGNTEVTAVEEGR